MEGSFGLASGRNRNKAGSKNIMPQSEIPTMLMIVQSLYGSLKKS